MIPHILIVDADAGAAHVTSAIVAHVVPTVMIAVAPTPAAGLLQVEQQLPDLLIIDPSPHTPTDLRLVQLLKQRHPAAHVLVLASATRPAIRRQFEALGVDAYQEKPAQPALLMECLRTILLDLMLTPAPSSTPENRPVPGC